MRTLPDDRQTVPREVALWRAVLSQAATDLGRRKGKNFSVDKSRAASWIDTPDFRTVCVMADLDPEATAKFLKLKAETTDGANTTENSRANDEVLA